MDSLQITEVKSWERFAKFRMIRCRRISTMFVILSFMFVISLCTYYAEGAAVVQSNAKSIAETHFGNICDWSGSGLDSEYESSKSSSAAGITPIYLSCTGGQVTWTYPRGALRVLLRLPESDNKLKREFKTCIKLKGDNKQKVVRVYLEGQRSLHPIEMDTSNQIRCFQSKKQQVALYIEATDWKPLDKHVIQLDYDLQPLPEGVTFMDPFEECRPCSSDELVHAFCTSDLVTRGIIKGVQTSDEETSQLNIRVTKLIRHIPTDTEEDDLLDRNEIVTHTQGRTARSVNIHVASQCGVSHGTGEFVFMARRRLGDFTIKCAPRLEDWIQTVRLVREEGRDHCLLNS